MRQRMENRTGGVDGDAFHSSSTAHCETDSVNSDEEFGIVGNYEGARLLFHQRMEHQHGQAMFKHMAASAAHQADGNKAEVEYHNQMAEDHRLKKEGHSAKIISLESRWHASYPVRATAEVNETCGWDSASALIK